MKFDVALGNPPYQENDNGGLGTSAKPIYQLFIESLYKIADNLAFIIPARWYLGGKGLDEFREFILTNKLVSIHNFSNPKYVFPSVKITGGVCIIHLTHNNTSKTYDYIDHISENNIDRMNRANIFDVVFRSNKVYNIINKIINNLNYTFMPFEDIVYPRNPYGINADALKYPEKYNLELRDTQNENDITVIGVIDNLRTIKYCDIDRLDGNLVSDINTYRVAVAKAVNATNGVLKFKLSPFILKPNEICSETYLKIGCYENKKDADLIIKYMQSKFFHALLTNTCSSHNISRKSFRYIPLIDFESDNIKGFWIDEQLYKRFGLSKDEVEYIENNF